ncbi:MAG: prephenate dehydrogenase, partial [Actinomycetes bacterium]
MTRTNGTVRIVGAGLLGTSIGLALTKLGVDVAITSNSPISASLASDMGAGRLAAADDSPSLIVVCVPPDATAAIVAKELAAYQEAVVTDVASVKAGILASLTEQKADLSRYVGSHPMAGRERGGAISGRADLFVGRPWVVVPSQHSSSMAVSRVENLALDLEATPLNLGAAEHDRAVALVSHLPQLVSSLLAARLLEANGADVNLAGQGLRDTTRIAASDPKLWVQILGANAAPVAELLKQLGQDLAETVAALEQPAAAGALATIGRVLERGNRGVERIPGKHGASQTKYSQVVVMIDDKPGELARLLTEIGEIGVNLEDLKLEHSPGAPIGLPELFVLPEVEQRLIE